jgi:hypothetical protein
MAEAAMAMAAAARVEAARVMAAAEMVVSVVQLVMLMGAASSTEGWAAARQTRARMQRRAARSSRT